MIIKIKELLNSDYYMIPIYQRDFAWREDELISLVRDIEGARRSGKREYYLGTLVTFFNNERYEVVDGQQRLTALSILFSLENRGENISLHYEARPISSEALKALNENRVVDHIFYKSQRILNEEIKKVDKDLFFKYLRENTYILRRVLLPDTDLNHYFEIMNRRQKQLTKCDYIFTPLLSLLTDSKEREVASIIIKGLSGFDRFLAGGIPSRVYNRIIWGDGYAPLLDVDYNTWWRMIKGHVEGEKGLYLSLDDALLFDEEEEIKPYLNEDKSGFFHSIIDFEEFLKLSLSIIYNYQVGDADIIDIFNSLTIFKTSDDVKYFLNQLLIIRYLFDTYIIKMTKEGWKLSKYIDINEYTLTFGTLNYDLVVLQSLFESALDDKEWISLALYYLKGKVHATGDEFLSFLKEILPKYDSERFMLYKAKFYDQNLVSIPYLVINNGKLESC